MKLRCVPEEGFLVSFAQSDGCVKLWDLDSAVLLRCLAFLTLSTPLMRNVSLFDEDSALMDQENHPFFNQALRCEFDVHVSRLSVTIVHKKSVRRYTFSSVLSYSFL